jgi:type I restriction enzyme S subunit
VSELPRGWATAPIQDIAEFNPKHSPDLPKNSLVSFVTMSGVDEFSGAIVRKDDRPLAHVWKGYTHFADKDVLIAKITPCMENGKAAVAQNLTNGIGCGSTEFHVLRTNGSVEPDFLWRYVRQTSFREKAECSMTGAVGQQRVPMEFLRSEPIALPPTGEQRRILAKIDRLSARSKRARDELGQVAKLVTRYKLHLLDGLFQSGSATPNWPTRRLAELATVGTGATPKKGTAPYYQSGTIPWITSGSVNDAIITATDTYITEKALKETNCKVFPAGTLLVAMYGEGKTRGKVSVLGIPATTNQALAAINIVDERKITKEFLLWFLRANYFKLRQQAAGGVQPNLNLGIIKSLSVPTPFLAEQIEVVRNIEHAFAAMDRLATEAQSARALLDRFDQAILAKAFRGELVPQDPNDEPAGVVLDRIRAERAAAPGPRSGSRRGAATAASS